MAAPQVIVHADDLGVHPSVNEGIEQAHASGIVTSASIMVSGDAVEDALVRIGRMPRLDLGLHFCLVGVAGFPPTLRALAKALISGRMSPAVIADALRRQLDSAVGRHRLTISHIDSHQHVHALPMIMRIVCEIAPSYGIRAVRLPREARVAAPLSVYRGMQAAALSAVARLSTGIVSASGLHTTRHFRGMAVSGKLTPAHLHRYLADAGNGITEIVCHPGADNASLNRAFPWGYDWQGELNAVCHPAIRRLVQSGIVTLATWRDVVSA
jgi:predicted glycoside hydrolase/deacetylase ChbG (UPF0249 family)